MLAPVDYQVPASMSPMIVSCHCSWPKRIPIQRSIAQVSDLCFLFRFLSFLILITVAIGEQQPFQTSRMEKKLPKRR